MIWALILIGVMIFANVGIGKQMILYPPLVFTSVWFFVLCFYSTGLVEMYSLHAITYICVTLACLAFTCGGAMACLLPDTILRAKISFWTHETSMGTSRKVLATLLVLLFPLFLIMLYRSGTSTGSFSLANVKAAQLAALAGEDSDQSSIASIYPLLALWITFICYVEKSDRISTLCLVITCFAAALSSGRTLILQLIIGVACIYLIRTGKNSIRAGYRILFAAAAVFLSLASLLVFFTKNMAEVGNDASAALQFYILGYVVSGLGPLDYVLNHPAEYAHAPHHTFKFLLQAGHALGLGTTPPPVMDEYLWIPFPTNVYTMLKPYLTDFGFKGMLIAVFILAFIQVFFYRRATLGNKISLLLTALLLYATILSFFDDLYVQAKNFGIPILLAILYFGLLRRITFSRTARWSIRERVTLNLKGLRLNIRKA